MHGGSCLRMCTVMPLSKHLLRVTPTVLSPWVVLWIWSFRPIRFHGIVLSTFRAASLPRNVSDLLSIRPSAVSPLASRRGQVRDRHDESDYTAKISANLLWTRDGDYIGNGGTATTLKRNNKKNCEMRIIIFQHYVFVLYKHSQQGLTCGSWTRASLESDKIFILILNVEKYANIWTPLKM